jgi:hypothetical protein
MMSGIVVEVWAMMPFDSRYGTQRRAGLLCAGGLGPCRSACCAPLAAGVGDPPVRLGISPAEKRARRPRPCLLLLRHCRLALPPCVFAACTRAGNGAVQAVHALSRRWHPGRVRLAECRRCTRVIATNAHAEGVGGVCDPGPP